MSEVKTEKEESAKKYIVTMPGTLNYKVGQVVELTDKKAKSLINKVRIYDEQAGAGAAKIDQASKADLEKAQKAASESQEREAALKAELDAMKAELEKATAPKTRSGK